LRRNIAHQIRLAHIEYGEAHVESSREKSVDAILIEPDRSCRKKYPPRGRLPSEQSKDCTDVSGRTFVCSILLNVGDISGMQAMDHYDRDML
jgi:hypothetical protein